MGEPSLIAHFYTKPLLQGRLILCPICSAKGFTEILGALNANGLIVSRHHSGATRIYGNFLIICTRCGLPIVQVRESTPKDKHIKDLIKEG